MLCKGTAVVVSFSEFAFIIYKKNPNKLKQFKRTGKEIASKKLSTYANNTKDFLYKLYEKGVNSKPIRKIKLLTKNISKRKNQL